MSDNNRGSGGASPLGYALVVLATAGWGTSGLFIKLVAAEAQISALALAFWRDLSTFACLLVGVVLLKPAYLRVRRNDLVWLAGLGIVSIGTFHILWNVSVWTNGVAVATVVQEAAPAFVALMAWLIWREPLNRIKILAILVTFAGCVLVVRLDVLGSAFAKVTLTGILAGLASAITYGTFSLFGKQVTGSYSSWTVLLYGFGFATLILFPLQFFSPGSWPMLTPARWWFVGLILLPTIISFGIYTVGLRYLPASVAAIVATSEVVFASLFAYLAFGERLDVQQLAGAALVIGGVVILSLSNIRRPKRATVARAPTEESTLVRGSEPPA